jgi:hypothetical protein
MDYRTLKLAATLAGAFGLAGLAWGAHPDQHGGTTGHLVGSGAWGNVELVGKVQLTTTPGRVADVAVSPDGKWAFLAHWGKLTCAANSEKGGTTDPDAGAWVVDISDLGNPKQVGFIASSQDSRPGEGMQVLRVNTPQFSGDLLVMNNEQCGKNGKGGISLWDVTNPRKPYKLSEHFGDRGKGDVNEIHSAFAWQAGGRVYAVMTDNAESRDVDILDITNPHRPRLIADLNLNTLFGPLDQPALGLSQSFLHDMVVKKIGANWVMLLSYWDGGYVQLNVNDPARPFFISQTDYKAIDPELLRQTGRSVPPEGNGHQAEFTADNRFVLGTDEDFSPYRALFEITSGPNAATYAGGEFGWTVPVLNLPDKKLNGPTVFGGYGCPGDRANIPLRSAVFPPGSLAAGEEAIIVFERGPVEDPSQTQAACFFSEKVESAQLAGYDGVVIANHHAGAQGGAAPDAQFCGGQGHEFTVTIPGVCVAHRAMHLLFGVAPRYDIPYAGGEPVLRTVGQRVSFTPVFDGWGYVHLFDRQTARELDTYAIPEAMDPAKAFGYGDLSVHEVATHPVDPSRAFLSYYSGGIRALQIRCAVPADTTSCRLVETGGYLDAQGNNFWGVEVFVGADGRTYILGSDRDSGLWIFRTSP